MIEKIQMDYELGMSDIYGMTNTFKDRVVSRLHELGINAAEASRRMKKSNNFVHDIVSERKKSVQGANLKALADALECSSSWLLNGQEPMKGFPAPQLEETPSNSHSEEWDHEAYMEAAAAVKAMKERQGVRFIRTEEYVETVMDIYETIVAEKRHR